MFLGDSSFCFTVKEKNQFSGNKLWYINKTIEGPMELEV